MVVRSEARLVIAVLLLALVATPAATARPQNGQKGHKQHRHHKQHKQHRHHRLLRARAAMETCSAADTVTSNALQIDMTMLCLHNAERRARGLSQVRWSPALAEAAQSHARDMVTRHYFAHDAPGGASPMDRLAATGYAPSVGCWSAAENMVLSRGPSTPRQLWLAWMRSPAHRANIVKPGWQDFALGVVGSSPQGDGNGLTVVAMFGMRSKGTCG